MELRARVSIPGAQLDLTGLALACIFLGVPPKVVEGPRFLEAYAAKGKTIFLLLVGRLGSGCHRNGLPWRSILQAASLTPDTEKRPQKGRPIKAIRIQAPSRVQLQSRVLVVVSVIPAASLSDRSNVQV